MRPGCQYVLHSTSQLYPHKRKHEKKDIEPMVYGSYSMADMMQPSSGITPKEEKGAQSPQPAASSSSATMGMCRCLSDVVMG